MPGCLKTCLRAGAVLLASFGPAAASTTQPVGIDLGATSFNDGFGKVAPGLIYQTYFDVERFDAINNGAGDKIGRPVLNQQSIQALASVQQLIYVTPLHLFGGAVVAGASLPLLDLSAHNDRPAMKNLKANGFGAGDLTWGAGLQMPPVFYAGRPIFAQRFVFQAIAPTGAYDKTRDINQSSGFWSLNPYWAFTVLPAPGFEVSSRLEYLYNFANDDPAGSGPPATLPRNAQAGQALFDNFAASYHVLPGLQVGVNGYYFRQITQDKVNGMAKPNTETTNFAIGPGLTYALDKGNRFFANADLPVVEKNTVAGYHLTFRWVHVF